MSTDEPFDVSDPFEFGKYGDRARGRAARARREPDRDGVWDQIPVATVFGAGIAGLTAAHELMERGFYVQVVEPVESQEEERACEVGGLARSQPARFRRSRRTHPNVGEANADWLVLKALRDRKLQRVQRRFGFPERISLPAPRLPPSEVSGADLLTACALIEDEKKRKILLSTFADPEKKQTEKTRQVAELVALLDPYLSNALSATEREPWARIYRIVTRLLRALVHYRRDLAGELKLLSQRDRKTYRFADPVVRQRETLLVEIGVQCAFFDDDRANKNVSTIWAEALKEALGSLFSALAENNANANGPGTVFLNQMRENLRPHDVDLFTLVQDLYARLSEEDASNLKLLEVDFGSLADDVLSFKNHLEAVPITDTTERNRAQADFIAPPRNCIMLTVVEHVVMGEHGFRYFPAFYRHLFETMRRTPILDEKGRETNRTTFDELNATPPTAVGIAGIGEYREFSSANPSSVEELREGLDWISRTLEFSARDQLRYQTQVLKFMTSCTERREKYESLSWLEFVDGRSEYDDPDPEGALERNGFSQKGAQLICDVPQLLVAMSAQETDARTNGQVSLQQTLSRDGAERDAFLNGPTSTAWLQHWKRYLKREGVRFFTGRLHSVWHTEDGLAPHVIGPSYLDTQDQLFPIDVPRPEMDPDGTTPTFIGLPEQPKGPYTHQDARNELRNQKQPTECVIFQRHDEYWVRRKMDRLHYCVLAVPYQAATEILWNVDGLYDLKGVLEPFLDLDKLLKRPPLEMNGVVAKALDTMKRYDTLCGVVGVVPFHGMDNAARDAMFQHLRLEEIKKLACAAEQFRTQALRVFDGDLETLLGFDVEASRRDTEGNRRPRDRNEFGVDRDALGLPYDAFRFPLRDLIGVQYYFRERTRIGRGNFILPVSEWGVSGVGQVYVWRRQPVRRQGVIGQLSVDIGNAYREYPREAGRLRRTVWQSTPNEVAQIAWSQILEAAGEKYAGRVRDPHYYQIDDGLKYELKNGLVLPKHNENMLLINLPGQWKKRPGLKFEDKTQPEIDKRKIEYTVSNDRWVMAGNHMATHTRLSTMESANESGRHAVNAILQHVNQWGFEDIYRAGFMGDFCPVFDPEQFELADLEPLKRLDKELLKQKIPHLLEVLGIPEAIDRLPIRDDPKETPLLNLARLIETAAERAPRDWDFLKGYAGLGLASIDNVIGQLKRFAGVSSEALNVILNNLKSNKNY